MLFDDFPWSGQFDPQLDPSRDPDGSRPGMSGNSSGMASLFGGVRSIDATALHLSTPNRLHQQFPYRGRSRQLRGRLRRSGACRR